MKKEMTLLKFLNTRNYLNYDYNHNEGILLAMSDDTDNYNILYVMILDDEGNDTEANEDTILNTTLDNLYYEESSYYLNYANEEILDDFIRTKMFQL